MKSILKTCTALTMVATFTGQVAAQEMLQSLWRAGPEWHHTLWDFRNVIVAGELKIHFDVQFTRYRADNSVLGTYRSLWVVAKLGGRWAVQLRSTYAA